MILDKFYTKKNVALECIKSIKDIDKYDLIIEPSAGAGAFSHHLPKCIAYDIAPEGDNIIQQDFLLLDKNDIPNYNNMLIIGNPPFGIRSSLAKQFIKHSIKLGANTIAFILPDIFNKYTNQKVFPSDWHLIKVIKLSGINFTADGEEYYVPCSFYIWTNSQVENDLRERMVEPVPDFSFLNREDINADFSINGNNGKVKNIQDITNPKSEHYIKVNDGYDVAIIKNRLENLTYNFNSSVNGNNAWLGQQDILKTYRDIYY